MFNILCWNARGLGQADKRRVIRDYLQTHKIDILIVQETKKESFTTRQFNSLSPNINHWIFKCSQGSSGGILLGLDDSKFLVLDTWIKDFSVSVLLSNKTDSFIWLFTSIYGPVLSS